MKTQIDSDNKSTEVHTQPADRPRKRLDIGCTTARHAQIGINAVVNARGGLQVLNGRSIDEHNLYRDARNIRARQTERVRFYQFNSRFFSKHQNRLSHLLSSYGD